MNTQVDKLKNAIIAKIICTSSSSLLKILVAPVINILLHPIKGIHYRFNGVNSIIGYSSINWEIIAISSNIHYYLANWDILI